MRKVKDWTRYGHCPTCSVESGQPCIDRRFLHDAFTDVVAMKIAHVSRVRLFRKARDEERTSN